MNHAIVGYGWKEENPCSGNNRHDITLSVRLSPSERKSTLNWLDNSVRMRRTLLTQAVACCVLVVSTYYPSPAGAELHAETGSARPEVPDTPAAPLSWSELARQREFRKEIGFDSSAEYVRMLNNRPKDFRAVRSRATYGLTVTPAEAEELSMRAAVQESLDRFEAEAKKRYGDSFSGIYTDQAAGGLVYVGFTSGAANKAKELSRFVAAPERVRGFETKHTYASLRATAAEVSNASGDLHSHRITLTHVSVEIATNRVEIGISEVTPAAVSELTSRFGVNHVRVVEAKRATLHQYDAGRDVTIRDLRGGLTIRWNRVGGEFCSTAFMAMRGAERAVITAGHCNNTGGTERFQGRHADGVNRSIGHRVANLFAPGNRVDAQAVRLNSNIIWRDDVYLHPSRNLIDVGSWQASGDADHAGDFVCMTGTIEPGTTNSSNCGILTRKDYAPSYWPGQTMAPTMRCATYRSQPGDSGGAVYRELSSGIHALGIHSGTGCGAARTETIYSHIGNAMVDLGGFQIITQ